MHTTDWKWQLRNSFSGPEGLRAICAGDPLLAERLRVIETYPFRVTPYYRSVAGAIDDPLPLVRQFMPDPRETDTADAAARDPFGEHGTTGVSGVIHRYPDRIVFLATARCAVRCRHCTRKNTLAVARGGRPDVQAAAAYVRARSAVREVIVSGGDPLLLETGDLAQLLAAFRSVPHVEVLRIGTRVPAVLPMRVDDALCRVLREAAPLWVNTHFNHPAELTAEAREACRRLADAGLPVSNQAVLLRGVNDVYGVMKDLCTTLQANRVRPYYVFLCDPVRGTAHLRTGAAQARDFEERLRCDVGGLAQPRFVADLPVCAGKTPVARLASGQAVGAARVAGRSGSIINVY